MKQAMKPDNNTTPSAIALSAGSENEWDPYVVWRRSQSSAPRRSATPFAEPANVSPYQVWVNRVARKAD